MDFLSTIQQGIEYLNSNDIDSPDLTKYTEYEQTIGAEELAYLTATSSVVEQLRTDVEGLSDTSPEKTSAARSDKIVFGQPIDGFL